MPIKKVLATTLATGAMAAGMVVVTQAPASAGVFGDCADGYACFWNGNGYTSSKWQFSGWNSNWANYGRSNQDNSVKNDGNTSAVDLYNYTGQNSSGGWMCVARGVAVYSYGSTYPANLTSSNGWYGGNGGYC